jgi:hypothetical protein
MIVDLQEAGYHLPTYVTYNFAEIPFAYPPLAFYFSGLISDLLNVSALSLIQILPSIVSALAIPAFYLLVKELTNSNLQIIFSVFAFALIPRVFAWHIMGGGITRSFGLLFALLTMKSAYCFYNEPKPRYILQTILLGALTVATHPEATVHTAITALIFYLWKDRSRKGILLSLGIAVGILTLTLPWWGLVINRHGLDPFLASVTSTGQDSINPLIGLIVFFRFMFTDETLLPNLLTIFSVIGLIGFFASLARKQFLLPAWIFILHVIEPRGGTLYMMIPLSLMVGYALENVVIPALRYKDELTTPAKNIQQELEQILGGKVTRYFILFLFAYSLMSAYSTGQKIKNEFSLQPTDLQTFTWVKENTPKNSEFLLVTGQLPLRDAWSEWFPVLTGRRSQASVFGYEWVNDGQFGRRVEAYEQLQSCAYEDATCIENWQQRNNNNPSFVYIWNHVSPTRLPLALYLQQDARYSLVYENEQTMIFQKVR